MKPVVIVGAAIVRDGALLAQQRAYPEEAAGLWELPGGRVEEGEPEEAAVRRECAEELGVAVEVGERVGADVPLPGGKVLRIFAATLAEPSARPHAVEHRALRWVGTSDVAGLDWLPADRVLVPELEKLLRDTGSA
ncbi:(deoxy)nucleoside triphosphate pyrophosphohydrolase [Prauserella sp. PE36]|uniref:(deoxy)nucleoside triphosphate pyrophosphohydrolase n=1 Tax=Prauserella sp. PE36 TaxID=1504709 RepID=UPI001F220D4A|nr:NUDIX domain-containing protein [Prauserella sp. PE36]